LRPPSTLFLFHSVPKQERIVPEFASNLAVQTRQPVRPDGDLQ
jgi:hypothetical protein